MESSSGWPKISSLHLVHVDLASKTHGCRKFGSQTGRLDVNFDDGSDVEENVITGINWLAERLARPVDRRRVKLVVCLAVCLFVCLSNSRTRRDTALRFKTS